jgi:plastocyanin
MNINPIGMRTYSVTVIAPLLLFVLASISSAYAYEVISVEQGGELRGTITLKGEVPDIQTQKIMRDNQFCGDTFLDDTYQINPVSHRMKNLVVSVEGISRGKSHSPLTALLENRKCHFHPRIIAVMTGDSYEVKNSDPVLHNTHLRLEDATILNVAMPPSGKNIRKPLLQAGSISVNCDAHSFMRGHILVFDHPYSTVTDEEGSFKIPEIPPGKYNVKIWHNGISVKETQVIVNPSAKTNLSLELSLF